MAKCKARRGHYATDVPFSIGGSVFSIFHLTGFFGQQIAAEAMVVASGHQSGFHKNGEKQKNLEMQETFCSLNLSHRPFARSDRKSISLQMNADGLPVRAPYAAADGQIAEVVTRHAGWIEPKQKITGLFT